MWIYISNFIVENWLALTLFVLGIVGAFIIGLYFYKKTKMGARLVYQTRSIRLIGDEQALPADVVIKFGQARIRRLTKTHLVLWNSGIREIKGEDIIQEEPICCTFSEDSRILRAYTIKQTNPSNKVSIDIVDRSRPFEAVLDFGYLNQGDGAVIEILHNSELRYPKISGRIMGVKDIEDWGTITSQESKPSLFTQLSSFTAVLLSSFFMIMGVRSSKLKPQSEQVFLVIIYIVIALAILITVKFIFTMFHHKTPRELVLGSNEVEPYRQLESEEVVYDSTFDDKSKWSLNHWCANISKIEGNTMIFEGQSVTSGQTEDGSHIDLKKILEIGGIYEVSCHVQSLPGTTAQFYLWCHDNTPAHGARTNARTPSVDGENITLTFHAINNDFVRIHLQYVPGQGKIIVSRVSIKRIA